MFTKKNIIVSRDLYGFRIFDTLAKKNLVRYKSKDACEFAVEVLLERGLEDFKEFILTTKDQEEEKRILIHKTCSDSSMFRYFSIPNHVQLYKAVLNILQDEINSGNIKYYGAFRETISFNENDIESYPVELQELAHFHLTSYKRNKEEYKQNHFFYMKARKALEDQDGESAFEVLQDLLNNVEIINPITI